MIKYAFRDHFIDEITMSNEFEDFGGSSIRGFWDESYEGGIHGLGDRVTRKGILY